jgi:importin-5
MQEKDKFEESRRHLALEVLITLSETASAMVRKVAKKYMNRLGEFHVRRSTTVQSNGPAHVSSSSTVGDDGRSRRRCRMVNERHDRRRRRRQVTLRVDPCRTRPTVGSSNAVVGESSLDRLSCALGGKTVLNYILSTVQTMLQNRERRLVSVRHRPRTCAVRFV